MTEKCVDGLREPAIFGLSFENLHTNINYSIKNTLLWPSDRRRIHASYVDSIEYYHYE